MVAMDNPNGNATIANINASTTHDQEFPKFSV